MKKIKNLILTFFRFFGISVTRYNPISDKKNQLIKVLDLLQTDIIFDIGANEGQFAYDLFNHGFNGKIVSFEPLTSARKKLEILAKKNSKWFVHEQCALGSKNGEIEINISKNSVSSSVLPMEKIHLNAAPNSYYIGKEIVSIKKLDYIGANYLTSNSNIFIKIDVQGYELDVINGASEIIKKTNGIICELSLVPLYKNSHTWNIIVERLEKENFLIWALQPAFSNKQTGQNLALDVIFIKKNKIIF